MVDENNKDDVKVVTSKNSKSKLLIIFIILLVFIATVYFFIMPKLSEPDVDAQNIKQEKKDKDNDDANANKQEDEEVEEIEDDNEEIDIKKEASYIYDMEEEFSINVGDLGNSGYLRMKISIEIESQEYQKEIEENISKLRHVVIELSGSKSRSKLLTKEGRDELRRQIKVRFNQIVNGSFVKSILFTDFLIE